MEKGTTVEYDSNRLSRQVHRCDFSNVKKEKKIKQLQKLKVRSRDTFLSLFQDSFLVSHFAVLINGICFSCGKFRNFTTIEK